MENNAKTLMSITTATATNARRTARTKILKVLILTSASYVRRAKYASTTDSSTAALARARFASSSRSANASDNPAIARTSSKARALSRAARSHSMRSASARAAHASVLASVADSDAMRALVARSRLWANVCENVSSVRSSASRTDDREASGVGGRAPAPSRCAPSLRAGMRGREWRRLTERCRCVDALPKPLNFGASRV